jgi:hypothetical protein
MDHNHSEGPHEHTPNIFADANANADADVGGSAEREFDLPTGGWDDDWTLEPASSGSHAVRRDSHAVARDRRDSPPRALRRAKARWPARHAMRNGAHVLDALVLLRRPAFAVLAVGLVAGVIALVAADGHRSRPDVNAARLTRGQASTAETQHDGLLSLSLSPRRHHKSRRSANNHRRHRPKARRHGRVRGRPHRRSARKGHAYVTRLTQPAAAIPTSTGATAPQESAPAPAIRDSAPVNTAGEFGFER